jgi:hypothetical protein
VSREYVQSAADVPTFYLDGLETFKRMEMGCVGGCEPSIEMFEGVVSRHVGISRWCKASTWMDEVVFKHVITSVWFRSSA